MQAKLIPDSQSASQIGGAKALGHIPHVSVPRLSRLRQERLIFLTALSTPFLGFLMALALTIYSGVTWVEIGLLVGMFLMTVLGIEVGYHRLFSHHAFQTVMPIRVLLAIAGAMALQGPVVYWVSNHRRHHVYSDQAQDPHSPHCSDSDGRLEGFWHAHIGWIFSPERTCAGRYGRDLLNDPVIMRIDKLYFFWIILGLVLPAALGGALSASWFGIFKGFLWGGLGRIFLVQQGTYSINSLCHLLGSRPFSTHDKSCNNLWLTVPTLGGALHNNHHAFPTAAINTLEWWQIDPGGWFIRSIEGLGLAWNVKRPTAQMVEAKRKP
ncbi:MAG: acyl-CoA desaturase [Cyanobacteria bacterium P01_F01_bin.4]